VPIRLHMATPHWGRFELRVCPLSDASLVTENKEFSEACLAAHPLYLAPKALQPGALPHTNSPKGRDREQRDCSRATGSSGRWTDSVCARARVQA
jgi:hypothetical protein